jgi:hypothetical protein
MDLPDSVAGLKETLMLEEYRLRVGGRIFAEVPVGGVTFSGSHTPGGWPSGAARRIDGIRLASTAEDSEIVYFDWYEDDFYKRIRCLRDTEVELIEVKTKLIRGAIGQVIAGTDLFEKEYRVKVDRSTIVHTKGKTIPSLEWVCVRRGIALEQVSRDASVRTPVNKSVEDAMLQRYHGIVGGRIYRDVPIGWITSTGTLSSVPPKTKMFLDAVRLCDGSKGLVLPYDTNKEDFSRRIKNSPVELIELEPEINRGSVGRVITSLELFKHEYHVRAACPLVLFERGHEALQWVLGQRGVACINV